MRRFHGPPVEECFLTFSVESVRNLKKRANAQMRTIKDVVTPVAARTRLAARDPCQPSGQEMSYTLAVTCWGRVTCVAQSYTGNVMVRCVARGTIGELPHGGLGRAAWLLNCAVASCDEEAAPVKSVAS